ncbi:protein mono-ADP-ribosyltransferase PARP9 [Talpa occidentalis]|uniref:protein mono-ADP-ribosyltransferase PARP9 n=1 Tax=Talpa occidentalis TaxID=50954 RepID=UPI0018908267|nr:protein mono-ADP-ribosyltransferase PARP9 [Talpa occidentalis]
MDHNTCKLCSEKDFKGLLNYKNVNNPGTLRMDSLEVGVEAACSKELETGTLEKSYNWKIPINHNDFNVLKNNQNLLFEVLNNKFDCISTLVPPAWEGNNKSLQVFKTMLTPRLELSVWKDDLTRHAVDVVVNAANEELLHGGGLAHALVNAGGFEIQEESRAYISKFGKIPPGEIAVTKAGKLPCQFIVHAVGPQWKESDGERCKFLLHKAINNILEWVTRKGDIKTIAIPAVSSGIFRFPLHLCAEIIVETIKLHFQQKHLNSCLKEIHLVSNEDPTVAAFKSASEIIIRRNELESWMNQEAMPPFNTVVVNNVTLQIVQGYIEQQATDVIVNSANAVGDLKRGLVSQAILQQAGKEMEREFKKMTNRAPNPQLLLVTEGFKLSCRYVYHVLWDPYSNRVETLVHVMKICLSKCIGQNVTSISFPALGTGEIGISMTTAAKIMFDEVLEFARQYLEKKKLTVKFVIFPAKVDLYKIFSAEMEKIKSSLPRVSNQSVFSVPERERRENGHEATSPAISLMGLNPEKMSEAELWIFRILHNQGLHVIENNHILYFGKVEHDNLAQLQNTPGVSITENISRGKAKLVIEGAPADIIEVIMNIEFWLCQVQEAMARKKEQALWSLSGQIDQQPKKLHDMKEITFLKCLKLETEEIQNLKTQFENCGFQVIKVEKIDNVALRDAFQRKKMIMKERMCREPLSHRLFQLVPHQFCKAVSRVGFQRMYSASCDYKFGAGIYFSRNLKNLSYQVKETSATDKHIYVFVAEVLIGSFCQGHQSNIVAPPLHPGAIESHDSVVDNVSNPETIVIFSGMQAMPLYLWTCSQDHVVLQDTMLSPQQSWRGLSGSSVD